MRQEKSRRVQGLVEHLFVRGSFLFPLYVLLFVYCGLALGGDSPTSGSSRVVNKNIAVIKTNVRTAGQRLALPPAEYLKTSEPLFHVKAAPPAPHAVISAVSPFLEALAGTSSITAVSAKKQSRQLKPGDQLRWGEIIQAPKGTARIVLNTSIQVLVGDGFQMHFATDNNQEMGLSEGEIRVLVPHAYVPANAKSLKPRGLGKEQKFLVKTRTVTIATSAADFIVLVRGGHTSVSVVNGLVELSSPQKGSSQKLSAGQSVQILNSQIVPVMPAPKALASESMVQGFNSRYPSLVQFWRDAIVDIETANSLSRFQKLGLATSK